MSEKVFLLKWKLTWLFFAKTRLYCSAAVVAVAVAVGVATVVVTVAAVFCIQENISRVRMKLIF